MVVSDRMGRSVRRLPLIRVAVCLIQLGCVSNYRSARVQDGVSFQLEGGWVTPVEASDPDLRSSYGDPMIAVPPVQATWRYGRAATRDSWGYSGGIIVPLYFPGSVLEGYVQVPRRLPVDLGVGAHLGFFPSVFVVVSREVNSWLEVFAANRFMSALGEENGRTFHTNITTAGISHHVAPTLSILLGADYYYVPGAFGFGSGDDCCEYIDADFVAFGVAFDFHCARGTNR